MIYFDNAATGGRKPDGVLTAVHSAVKLCANPGRSGHKLSLACLSAVEECRRALSEFFGGYGYERVIFTKNCTEALNIALLGVLKQGDHVVTTCLEHNSVLRPLEFLKTEGVITYDVCPLTYGKISVPALLGLVKENTRMVVVTAASNVTGDAPPIAEISAALKERKGADGLPREILLICDGAQGGGHLPLDMQKLGIDGLAVAGHKGLMGIQGSGALLFSPRVAPRPILYGGTGSESYSLVMPDFYPDRLEAGTLSFPALLSLSAGIEYLTLKGQKRTADILSLSEYLFEEIKNLSFLRLYSRPNPCGILAFAHQKIPSQELAQILSDEHGIAVRGGLHCAPLAHKALGTESDGLVRVSLSEFNRKKELDVLLSALKSL